MPLQSAIRNAKSSALYEEGNHYMSQPEETFSSLEAILQGVNNSGYAQLLGMHVEMIQDGQGMVSIKVDARLMHPQMIVHGGVIFSLADTAMSMALLSIIPPGTLFSTIEAKINYLQPVRSGVLLADANIVQRGNSIAVLEGTVYNVNGEDKQAIARVLGTFHIASSRPKSKKN